MMITPHFLICSELNKIPTGESWLSMWSQLEGIPRWFEQQNSILREGNINDRFYPSKY